MGIEPSTAIAAGGMAIAGVVWLVRLEGRINVVQTKYEDLKADLQEIKADVKELLKRP